MSTTSNQPVSATNLSAALGDARAATGTGGKPVSVDNLKAALDNMSVKTLYGGPGTLALDGVPLSESVNNFGAIMFTASRQSSPTETEVSYMVTLPSAVTGGGKAQGIDVLYNTSSGAFVSSSRLTTDMAAEPSGTMLTAELWEDSLITRVFGINYS